MFEEKESSVRELIYVRSCSFRLKRIDDSSKLPLFMDTPHIIELLAPFIEERWLSPQVVEQLSRYLSLLLRWNAKTNLTAIRNEEHIVTRHFGESLFAARHLFPEVRAEVVVDLGSGAGFPGIPLKVYAPDIMLTLIESQNKKTTFLKEVVRTLELERVTIFNERAQLFPTKAELVTLRAVEHFEDVLPVAASLLNDSTEGRLALLISQPQVDCVRKTLPDFLWQTPIPVPLSSNRVLLVGTSTF
jgi:16S rRNA (guanine527-N7)-methyltransferase